MSFECDCREFNKNTISGYCREITGSHISYCFFLFAPRLLTSLDVANVSRVQVFLRAQDTNVSNCQNHSLLLRIAQTKVSYLLAMQSFNIANVLYGAQAGLSFNVM